MIFSNTKLHILFLKLLFIASFFPYIKIIDLPTDTQPYTFIISLIIIAIYSNFKVPYYFGLYIFIMILIAPLVGLYSGLNLLFIRSYVGYLSFLSISWASFILYKRVKITKRLFIKIVLIWFCFGFIQLFIRPEFGSFFVSGFRTTLERGVVSLAPEPSYYGIICITFLIFNVVIFKSSIVWILCLIQIFVFSQSFMVIAYLLLLVYFLMIANSDSYTKILIIILPFIAFFTVSAIFSQIEFNSHSRSLKLFSMVIENPLQVFKLDASANDRLAHIYYSLKGFFDNSFFPNGFNKWTEYITHEVKSSNFFWWISSGRIMSTYGAALFELGAIGVVVPYTLNKIILKKRNELKNSAIFLFLFINIFLLGAIPLAYPPLGLLMGYIMSIKNN